jgi:serine/threonine-protein kinase
VVLVEGDDGVLLVKLVDWGIAKLMDELPPGTDTTTGQLVGTPQYMSPEQARAKSVDGRTDVYSLGAIAYELFLEGPPFVADNIADLVTMHLRELPPSPADLWPDIPPELDRLLVGMLAKSMADRPSIEEITQTLRGVRGQLEARGRWARRLALDDPYLSQGPRAPQLLDRAPTWDARLDAPTPTPMPSWPSAPPLHRTVARALGAIAVFMTLAAAGAVVSEIASAPERHARADGAPPRPAIAIPVVASSAPVDQPPVVVDATGATPAAAEVAATIDLRVDPDDATVTIGGVTTQAVAGRVVAPVTPGQVEVVVEAPGLVPVRKTVEVESGTVLLEIGLTPAAPPAARRPVSRRGRSVDPDGVIDPYR